MSRTAWISLGLFAAVLIMTAAAYPSLPESMPSHWNIRGEVDGWMPKSRNVIIMPLIMAAMLVLFRSLPWLSPQPFTLDSFRPTYENITLMVLVFFAYMQGVMLWAALHPAFAVASAITSGVCVLFAMLGNVLGKVRRNLWVGVRTPWTIANDRVWNATHRLAGKLFVAAGVIGLVATMIGLPPVALFIVFIGAILLAALIPAYYSLSLYKSLEKRGELNTESPLNP